MDELRIFSENTFSVGLPSKIQICIDHIDKTNSTNFVPLLDFSFLGLEEVPVKIMFLLFWRNKNFLSNKK
jgi:hypothetical protein